MRIERLSGVGQTHLLSQSQEQGFESPEQALIEKAMFP